MGERNTEFLVQEWGVWLAQGGGVDLRARSALQSVIVPSESTAYECADISDDDALKVDRAMGKLKLHRPSFFRVVWLLNVCNYSATAAGRSLGISDREIGKLNSAGIAFVDVVLNAELFLSEIELSETILQAA